MGCDCACGGELVSLRPDRVDMEDSAYAALSSSGVSAGLNSKSSSTSNDLAESYRNLASVTR